MNPARDQKVLHLFVNCACSVRLDSGLQMRTKRLLEREGGVNPCVTEVLERLFASGVREEKVSVESLWPNKEFFGVLIGRP